MSLAIKAARAGGGSIRASTATNRMMGDPGLFGFLGKVGSAALGGAVGLATGGLQGAVRGAVSPFVSQPRAPSPVAQIQAPPVQGPGSGIRLPQLPRPAPGRVVVDPRAALPGGAPLVSRTPAAAAAQNGVACPPGFHANKADYFLRDGTFVPMGSRCVKNRRRNPLNPRALQKAVARVDAGKGWQSKLSQIETGKHTKAGKRKVAHRH